MSATAALASFLLPIAALAGGDSEGLRLAYERYGDSVVSVETVVVTLGSRGVPAESERRAVGIAVGPGEVLTSSDVLFAPLGGGELVAASIRLRGGRAFAADLIARDDALGLALLSFDAAAAKGVLQPAEFAADDRLSVGDVFATLRLSGPGFGWETYLDAYLVSARLERPRRLYVATFALADALGGPVVAPDGRLVGVVARVPVRDVHGGGEPLFVEPSGWSDDGREVVVLPASAFRSFLEGRGGEGQGRPAAWLGVRVQPLPRSLALALGLPEGRRSGVLVTRVLPGSPAAVAGLRPGDAIVALAGEPLDAPARLAVGHFRRREVELPVGKPVAMEVGRDGVVAEVTVTPALAPLPPSALPRARSEELDLVLRDLTPFERADLDLRAGGALVLSLGSGSPLAAAGLRAGDVVAQIEGDEVSGAEDAARRLEGVEGRGCSVLVLRGRDTALLRLRRAGD